MDSTTAGPPGETSRPAPRAVAWILAAAFIYPSALTWMYFVALEGSPSSLRQMVYGIGKVLQFALPLACWTLVQRRSAARLVAAVRPTRRGLRLAVAFGLAVFAAMFGLYFALLKPIGLFEPVEAIAWEKVSGLGFDSPLKYLGLAIFYSFVHSLLEEYYWRWFVYGLLRERWPMGRSLIVSSVGFMAHHVILLGVYFGWTSPYAWLFSAGVAVGGLFWAWLYERSGSLFGPWMSHLLIDAAIFSIGYELLQEKLIA